MVTDFQERLRQIREARDRECRERREESEAAGVERMSGVEQRLLLREEIEQIIGEYADKFVAEVPPFESSKSFFEGKYKIELVHDDLMLDEQGRMEKYFSRITFLIDTQANRGELVAITCKQTVRNRDRDSATISVSVAEPDLDPFRNFAEQRFFEFADAYFSSGTASGSPR